MIRRGCPSPERAPDPRRIRRVSGRSVAARPPHSLEAAIVIVTTIPGPAARHGGAVMYENRDQSQSTPGVGAFGGFVVGALLGAGLALLLAPASGVET